MSDFEDQIRASAERVRQRGSALADGADPKVLLNRDGPARGDERRSRWILVAGSVAVVAVGVAGLVVVSRQGSDGAANNDGTPVSTSLLVTTTTILKQSTEVEPVITGPPEEAVQFDLSRPIAHPEVCETVSAQVFSRTLLPPYPAGMPLTLFARPSSLPIPIQIIGQEVDGPAKPFAVLERFFDSDRDPWGREDPVNIGGNDIYLNNHLNGNGEAVWNLPDGSQGYLRSRGMSRDELLEILSALTPRPADANVPGFDYNNSEPGAPQLVVEQMNTDAVRGQGSGSQCHVVESGWVYQISANEGELLHRFVSVIDRPPPLEVGTIGETLVIISGIADPSAPSIDDIVNADEATWRGLLGAPGRFPLVEPPIGVVRDVLVELSPAEPTRGESSSLTLSINEREGVSNYEIYLADAVIADAAQYWKIEVDGRMSLRTTVGSQGVIGGRLGDGVFAEPVTIRISTTDGDDFVIQSTGDIRLRPGP